MKTITFSTAGQISEPVHVSAGSRVTLSGLGSLQYADGTLQSAKDERVTWATWPKGSTPGFCDVLRSCVMRAVSSGAMVFEIDDQKRDEGPEGVFFQESLVTSTVNPLTGGIELTAGDSVIPAITNFTFSALPAAALWAGRIARVTDLRNALFESNGTRWKPVNGSAVIASLDTDATMSGITETIVLQKALPAGLLKNGDRLRITITGGKSGISEQMTLGFRLGTAGTIADTSIQTYAFLSTTSISSGVKTDFKRLSATTVRKLGNGSQATSYSGTSTAAVPSAVTVANLDSNITYLSATLLMGAAVETATIYDMTVELVSSES